MFFQFYLGPFTSWASRSIAPYPSETAETLVGQPYFGVFLANTPKIWTLMAIYSGGGSLEREAREWGIRR